MNNKVYFLWFTYLNDTKVNGATISRNISSYDRNVLKYDIFKYETLTGGRGASMILIRRYQVPLYLDDLSYGTVLDIEIYWMR